MIDCVLQVQGERGMSGYNLTTYDGSIMTIEAGALVDQAAEALLA